MRVLLPRPFPRTPGTQVLPRRYAGTLTPGLYLPLAGHALWALGFGSAAVAASDAPGVAVPLGLAALLGLAAAGYLLLHESSVVDADGLRRPAVRVEDRVLAWRDVVGVRLDAVPGRGPPALVRVTGRRAAPTLTLRRNGGDDDVALTETSWRLTDAGVDRAGDAVRLLARLAGVEPDVPTAEVLRRRADALDQRRRPGSGWTRRTAATGAR